MFCACSETRLLPAIFQQLPALHCQVLWLVPASSSGASFFAWLRRARNASDWWWTARDHGKGIDGKICLTLARCLLPAFLCAHIEERRLGPRQGWFNNLFSRQGKVHKLHLYSGTRGEGTKLGPGQTSKFSKDEPNSNVARPKLS